MLTSLVESCSIFPLVSLIPDIVKVEPDIVDELEEKLEEAEERLNRCQEMMDSLKNDEFLTIVYNYFDGFFELEGDF